jgi:hypothetical protein
MSVGNPSYRYFAFLLHFLRYKSLSFLPFPEPQSDAVTQQQSLTATGNPTAGPPGPPGAGGAPLPERGA